MSLIFRIIPLVRPCLITSTTLDIINSDIGSNMFEFSGNSKLPNTVLNINNNKIPLNMFITEDSTIMTSIVVISDNNVSECGFSGRNGDFIIAT